MAEKETQIADVLNVVFMVDTSGSMVGDKINAVNAAMPQIKSELMDYEQTNSHLAELRFAVITFDSNVLWRVAPPKPLADFIWNDLSANGMTCFGKACKEVEQKLHKDTDFFKEMRRYKEPLVILLSDGEPNDDGWEENLAKLTNNTHFKKGTHIAIALEGIEAEGEAVLRNFAAEGCYIKVNGLSVIKNVIRLATMTASKSLSSSGSMTNVKVANTQAVNNVVNAVSAIPGVQAEAVDPSSITPLDASDYN